MILDTIFMDNFNICFLVKTFLKSVKCTVLKDDNSRRSVFAIYVVFTESLKIKLKSNRRKVPFLSKLRTYFLNKKLQQKIGRQKSILKA